MPSAKTTQEPLAAQIGLQLASIEAMGDSASQGVASFRAPHLGAVRHLLNVASPPRVAFERTFFEPGHFTASAFVLSPNRAQLLLIHHRKLGLWLQPGGHFEPQDTSLQDAAARELREETGVTHFDLETLLFDIDVHRIPTLGQEPEHLHHDLRVLLRARSLDFEAGSEVRDACWFSLEELSALSRESGIRDGERFVLENGGKTDASVVRAAARLHGLDSTSG